MPLLRDDLEFALAPRDADDEGLFGRDVNGQLVRLDAPTEADYQKKATLQIDGRSVTVPLAEPLKDAQGNILLDLEGRTTPRYTTIYDAAQQLKMADPGGGKLSIPVLCHQPHMAPVAVCRMCVVQVYGVKRGRRAPERKLLPACQHQVKDGMEVFTMDAPGPDGERVRRSVRMMTELLTADHLKPSPASTPQDDLATYNELRQLADRVGANAARCQLDVLKPPHGSTSDSAHTHRSTDELDVSSPVFIVDHSACILCDRCSRACDEVKQNHVIGRTGKGSAAAIGFDLNDPMGDSSCVQCGECMVSCPTTAITFKPVATVKPRSANENVELLTVGELIAEPMFAEVPGKFLLWQEGLALRRKLKAGDILCRQGEAGNTAYLIRTGRLEIVVWDKGHTSQGAHRWGGLGKSKSSDAPLVRVERTPADVIVGEMSCLSGMPRTADIRAIDDSEVWEVRRNVLDRAMRSPSQRNRFETIYRKHALDIALRNLEIFDALPPDEYQRCVDFLRPQLAFVSVAPGQTIFRQGDWADCLYLIRLGHVRVGIEQFGREASVIFRGPETVLGEIGLLALSPSDADQSTDKISQAMEQILRTAPEAELSAVLPAGQRTATCVALDHVELARIERVDFLRLVKQFPAVLNRLIEISLTRLRGDRARAADANSPNGRTMREYVEKGLYQGQSLLVLDLHSCTRCDECTKACVDQHGDKSHGAPITRLLREGVHFGDYLVATSCRSCKDAYCMIGCPVDSIHRGKHQQIVIEDHCIGCGLCASNCPFGNIWILPDERPQVAPAVALQSAATKMTAKVTAATCDLCDAEGKRDEPLPRCVYACPHDAAHRMSGAQLLQEVMKSTPGNS